MSWLELKQTPLSTHTKVQGLVMHLPISFGPQASAPATARHHSPLLKVRSCVSPPRNPTSGDAPTKQEGREHSWRPRSQTLTTSRLNNSHPAETAEIPCQSVVLKNYNTHR